jgi:hypothetical protein
MRSLSDLLLKYKIPGVQSSEIRRICAEEVFNLTGCKLTPAQIEYKNENLRISVPPVLKSALLIKKIELMDRIKARNIELHSFK